MNYRSQRQFAAAIGISQPAVCKLLRRDDCPVRRWSPWTKRDLEAMRRWRANLQEDRSAIYADGGDAQLVDMSPEEFERLKASVDELVAELIPH